MTSYMYHLTTTFFAFCVLLSSAALAQDPEGLGTNPLTNRSYECVRFNNSNQNTIVEINQNTGKQKSISTKKAGKTLRKNLKKARKQQLRIRKLLRRAQKKLQKAQSTLPLSPSKIEQLSEQVASLDSKLAVQTSRIEAVKALQTRVKDCKKTKPTTGGFQVFSEVYEVGSSTLFVAKLVYVVDTRPAPTGIQARVSGHSQPIPGGGGVYFNEAPHVSSLGVHKNLCLVNVNGECRSTIPGYSVYFASIGGWQNPGSCSAPSYKCSVGDAVSFLNNYAGSITMHIVGSDRHEH
jgi:hypothetical protein